MSLCCFCSCFFSVDWFHGSLALLCFVFFFACAPLFQPFSFALLVLLHRIQFALLIQASTSPRWYFPARQESVAESEGLPLEFYTSYNAKWWKPWLYFDNTSSVPGVFALQNS